MEKCKFSGSYALTTGTYDKDSLVVPASGTPVAVTGENFESLIVGEKTVSGITVTDDNFFSE